MTSQANRRLQHNPLKSSARTVSSPEKHPSWQRPEEWTCYLTVSVTPPVLCFEDGLGLPGLEVAHAWPQDAVYQHGRLYMLRRAGGRGLL